VDAEKSSGIDYVKKKLVLPPTKRVDCEREYAPLKDVLPVDATYEMKAEYYKSHGKVKMCKAHEEAKLMFGEIGWQILLGCIIVCVVLPTVFFWIWGLYAHMQNEMNSFVQQFFIWNRRYQDWRYKPVDETNGPEHPVDFENPNMIGASSKPVQMMEIGVGKSFGGSGGGVNLTARATSFEEISNMNVLPATQEQSLWQAKTKADFFNKQKVFGYSMPANYYGGGSVGTSSTGRWDPSTRLSDAAKDAGFDIEMTASDRSGTSIKKPPNFEAHLGGSGGGSYGMSVRDHGGIYDDIRLDSISEEGSGDIVGRPLE